MSENPPKARIRNPDRERLRQLKSDEEVQEMAEEQGVIEGEEDLTHKGDLMFSDLLRLIIPEDAEEMERPEDDMVWISIFDEDLFEQIKNIAGENISIHEVIHHHLNNFTEEYDYQIEVENDA